MMEQDNSTYRQGGDVSDDGIGDGAHADPGWVAEQESMATPSARHLPARTNKERRPSDRQCQVKPRPQRQCHGDGLERFSCTGANAAAGWLAAGHQDGRPAGDNPPGQTGAPTEERTGDSKERIKTYTTLRISSTAVQHDVSAVPWCLLLTPGLAQSLASQEKEPHESGLGRRAGRRARRWGRRRDGRTLTCRHCRASRGIDRAGGVPGPGACGLRS